MDPDLVRPEDASAPGDQLVEHGLLFAGQLEKIAITEMAKGFYGQHGVIPLAIKRSCGGHHLGKAEAAFNQSQNVDVIL